MNRRGMPTAWQRELIEGQGLNPDNYIVISCNPTKLRLANRGDGRIIKIKRTAGVSAPCGSM